LFILLSCLTAIGCADAASIDEASFFDQWWILSETGDAIREYEMTYCFYPDSNGEIIFQDVDFYWEEEVYDWTEIGRNTYDIEDFAVIKVEEEKETEITDDWHLTLKRFPFSTDATAIPCHIFTEEE
jgi:hypothetical protein